MNVRLMLLSLAFIALLCAACSDDDGPVSPKKPGPTPFNTSQMPITVPYSNYGYGNLALDGSGNLIFATENGVLHRVSRNTGKLEVIAANVGITEGGPYRMLSCVYDPGADRFYVGEVSSNPTRIYSVNPVDGSSELLVDLGDNGYPQQLLLAPSGFGLLGGYLLVFTFSGGGNGIVAVNPGNPLSPSAVSTLKCTSAAFGPDGTLYATDYALNRVVTVSPTGVVTEFVDNMIYPEGIAVNSGGSRLYVACVGMSAGVDSIYSVTIPGGTVTALGFEPDLDDGYYPTGLILDGTGKLIFNGGETELIIDYFSL